MKTENKLLLLRNPVNKVTDGSNESEESDQLLHIQLNFNISNTGGLFTMADLELVLSP